MQRPLGAPPVLDRHGAGYAHRVTTAHSNFPRG
ncbi:hypothetical protein GKJPGBOP_05468 [Streptomyces paromomycinus]|uniref:Uncharacterized protein n=1 Tax=Streptomyces paromomycinus TaxID=92743 RepID=A0A401W8U3_STREY|nr:hypothetical protein GKJPGBOP_05468 [Streptomyces paromomycinus]